jgi:hypothetical protein
MMTSNQVKDLTAALETLFFSDMAVPNFAKNIRYLAVFFVADDDGFATLVVAGLFATGVFGAADFFTGTAGALTLSRLGVETERTAAFRNSILVPGVVSTTNVESPIDATFPVIPPIMTTSAPTLTELAS